MRGNVVAAVARRIRQVRHRPACRRYAQKAQNNLSRDGVSGGNPAFVVKEEPVDPRPPWLFTSATLLRVTIIPVGLIYAVFYHDFGEDEHVFMPPRRWLQRQKERFLTLSPAEKHLADDANKPTE
ncbi:hypothetical protein EW145_g3632 [Phellinidium pouzarii]|uniref:Uncharacterized protein n=1 Tax=Phellinidium pouzarii TaxID=167371 RepID=A0A4V3XCU5_9AGAM|nr:hypothetical protein EW145_g3632 [Phellinidium pouzarii]